MFTDENTKEDFILIDLIRRIIFDCNDQDPLIIEFAG